MKKSLLVVIVALSIVTMLFSTAAAPRGVTLDSFALIEGKGYVAVFNIKGEWRQDELWGFVYTGHHRQFDMDCHFRDDGKVSCVVYGGISEFAKRPVKLVLYGYAFPVVVPPRPGQ